MQNGKTILRFCIWPVSPSGIVNRVFQSYNRLLKQMGKESGIFDSEVVLVEQRRNQKLEIRKKKWEYLESHTARRTFITRSITKVIPLNVIMGITGHTRIDTLTRYMDKYTPTNGYREVGGWLDFYFRFNKSFIDSFEIVSLHN